MADRALHKLVAVERHRYANSLQQTHDALGIRFPVSYVNRGVLYSLIDRRSCPVGGAIVVLQPPFRSLQAIPGKPCRDARELAQGNSVAEVNGLWLCRRTRNNICASFSLWTQLLRELLETGCQQFLFTFDNSNQQMANLVRWARPRVLYTGRTRQLPGMTASAEETIASVSRAILDAMLGLLGDPNSKAEFATDGPRVGRADCQSVMKAA